MTTPEKHDQLLARVSHLPHAVASALVGLSLSDTAIDLAGYSFGAWVNAGLSAGFQRMVMVSPPVAFMSFDPPAPIPTLRLIVTGGRDDIAPAATISTYQPHWNPAAALQVLPDADHFYTGSLKTLEDTLAKHIG